MRNSTRIIGKLRRYTNKITHIYAANLPKVAYLVPINALTLLFCSMVGYTNYLMKVLERRVEGLIRQRVVIDDMQCGFMTGCGTTDAIFIVCICYRRSS